MNLTRTLVLVLLVSLATDCAVTSDYRPPVFGSPGERSETGERDLLAETGARTNSERPVMEVAQ